MTKGDIQKSIVKVRPNSFEIPYFGRIIVHKDSTVSDLWEELYNSAVQMGVEKGKRERSEEIRNLINQ